MLRRNCARKGHDRAYDAAVKPGRAVRRIIEARAETGPGVPGNDPNAPPLRVTFGRRGSCPSACPCQRTRLGTAPDVVFAFSSGIEPTLLTRARPYEAIAHIAAWRRGIGIVERKLVGECHAHIDYETNFGRN